MSYSNNFVDHSFDICMRSAMVNDTGTQGEAPMNGGVGDVDSAAELDSLKYLHIESVKFGFAEQGEAGAKRKHTALSGTGAITSRSGVCAIRRCQVRGHFEVVFDLLTKGAETVKSQREPQL